MYILVTEECKFTISEAKTLSGKRSVVYNSDKSTLLEALDDYTNNLVKEKIIKETNLFSGTISDSQITSVEVVTDLVEHVPKEVTFKEVFDLLPVYYQEHYKSYNYTQEIKLDVENETISDVVCECGYELVDESIDGEFENIEDYFNCIVRERC